MGALRLPRSDPRVDIGCRDIRMPEDVLDVKNACASGVHMGCAGMTKCVRGHVYGPLELTCGDFMPEHPLNAVGFDPFPGRRKEQGVVSLGLGLATSIS